jgi:hypothetical protein
MNFGRSGVEKVRQTAFVVILSLFFVIWNFLALTTFCDLNSSAISCSVHIFNSRHRMIPLLEFRVLWGSTDTGMLSKDVIVSKFEDWVSLETSTVMFPFRRILTILGVPAVASMIFLILKGLIDDKVCAEFDLIYSTSGVCFDLISDSIELHDDDEEEFLCLLI